MGIRHEPASRLSGDHYRTIRYEGSPHGMMLIQPEVEPDALLLILDFLELSLGLR